MEYDLSLLPVPVDDHGRALRVLVAACLVIPIAGVVWYFTTIPLDALFTANRIAVLIACAFFIVMLSLALFGLGPGATRCSTDDTGFTLYYRKRAERRFSWSDPRLHISIGEVVTKRSTSYDLSTRMPWHNLVSADLYAWIVSVARKRGLAVAVHCTEQIGMKVTTVDIRTVRGSLPG